MNKNEKEATLKVIRDVHHTLALASIDDGMEFQIIKNAYWDTFLADITARLPYGTKVNTGEYFIEEHALPVIKTLDEDILKEIRVENNRIQRTYLFPMSSMTEEQKREYNSFSLDADWVSNPYYCVPAYNTLDWLNKNHIDYRGLIEKGLALDATGLNIY